MIQPGMHRVLRLSSLDYIASLVRSDAYITDYEKYLAAYQIEKDERQNGTFHREEGNARSDFLNRWPLLWEPIPPFPARKAPMRYLDCLLPAVCVEEYMPPGWFKSAHKFPWPEGRYHSVRINFFRPESEIIAGIKTLTKEMRFPGFKISVSKAKWMPDPWKVWDTFKGAGMEDIRKTAETLFPKSFRYGNDKKEMKKEARKNYEAMIETHSPNEAMAWYDNRLYKAKAAKWRQVERKKLIAGVRGVIGSCRQKIEMHLPVTGVLPIVSARLRCPGKNNLPS